MDTYLPFFQHFFSATLIKNTVILQFGLFLTQTTEKKTNKEKSTHPGTQRIMLFLKSSGLKSCRFFFRK